MYLLENMHQVIPCPAIIASCIPTHAQKRALMILFKTGVDAVTKLQVESGSGRTSVKVLYHAKVNVPFVGMLTLTISLRLTRQTMWRYKRHKRKENESVAVVPPALTCA